MSDRDWPGTDLATRTIHEVIKEVEMVYLALTPQGLQEILNIPEAAEAPVWCGANALSEAEFAKLGRANVTRFTYSFAKADKATVQRALSTIEEHHPGERIWVESAVFED